MLYVRYEPLHPNLPRCVLDTVIDRPWPTLAADIAAIKAELAGVVKQHWPSAADDFVPVHITLHHWQKLDG
jgi:hypothetical protein